MTKEAPVSIPRHDGGRLRLGRAGVAALLMATVVALPVNATDAPAAPDRTDAPSRPAVARVSEDAASGSIATVVRDGDDTDGRLDIRSVGSRVDAATGQARRLQYVVRTYEAFQSSSLHHRWRRLALELDTDGQPGAERHVVLSARDGRLSAELVSNATREVLARLRVSHPSPTRVRFSGLRDQLGARKLFWTADWHRRGHPACGGSDGWAVTCQDSVPDDGWLRLDRPAWP
jgi:hypothetical protein